MPRNKDNNKRPAKRRNDSKKVSDSASSKNRQKSFRRSSIALLIAAILSLAAGYPIASYAFGKMIESDYTYTIIPNSVFSLIPASAVEKATSTVKGMVTFLTGRTSDSSTASSGSSSTGLDTGSLDTSSSTDPTILAETTPISDSYLEASIFLGDYSTTPLKEFELIPAANVFAQNDATPADYTSVFFTDPSSGTDGTIATLAASRKPARFYIALGANGAASADDAYYQAFRDLIDTLLAQSPASSIILESVYPVSASPSNTSLTNAAIDSVNTQLLAIAREKKIYYLDVNSSLKDSTGVLNPSYDSGDGIHCNKAGYTAIMNYIKSHAVPTS